MPARRLAKSYPITKGDGRSTEELVDAGRYGYAHSCLISENFPARHSGRQCVREIVLLEFDTVVSAAEAIAEALQAGLERPMYEDALGNPTSVLLLSAVPRLVPIDRSPMRIRKLHFVYNVELTPRALVEDFLHRLRDPATYPCRLCDLTYGRFVKKPGWIDFVRKLPVDSLFYTKDEFQRKHPGLDHPFPVVLAERSPGEFEAFLSREELQNIRTLDELESEVARRLAAAPAD